MMLRLNGYNTHGKLESRTAIGDRTVGRNGKSGGHFFVVFDNQGGYFWKTQAIQKVSTERLFQDVSHNAG